MKRISCIVLVLSSCFLVLYSINSAKQTYDISSINFNNHTYPVLILGGGVAGLTAANYCAQANIPCIVIEGSKPGGALAQSDSVRNWPGLIEVTGDHIVSALKKQVVANGVSVVAQNVIDIDVASWPFTIRTTDNQTKEENEYTGLTCIVAMGAEPNYLGIPGEQEYWGKGVSNCAVCDGSLYKNKDVAIVGGGDSAVVEAAYLASIARSVTIFVRKNYFRANDKRKTSEILKRANVSVNFNTQIAKVLGDGELVTNLVLENNKTGESNTIAMDGLFLAIGSTPNTKLFGSQLALDDHGYIICNEHQHTLVPGVFAAGDICDPVYKQAVTSASDGCKAALQAQEWLDEVGFQLDFCTVQLEKPVRASSNYFEHERKVEPTHIIEIENSQQLQQLLADHSQPLVIDVYGDLCLACKNMEPIFESLANKFSDTITFVKFNLSGNDNDITELVSLLDTQAITSVPAFLMIKGGKEVERLAGEVSEPVFYQRIAKVC